MWEYLEIWGRGEFAIGMIMKSQSEVFLCRGKNMEVLNSVFRASRGSFSDCSFPLLAGKILY